MSASVAPFREQLFVFGEFAKQRHTSPLPGRARRITRTSDAHTRLLNGHRALCAGADLAFERKILVTEREDIIPSGLIFMPAMGVGRVSCSRACSRW